MRFGITRAILLPGTPLLTLALLLSPATLRAEQLASDPVESESEVSLAQTTSVKPTLGAEATTQAPKPRALFQHASYPAAWKAAQESNRPILIFVSMPNCHYCVKMKKQVLRIPHVKQMVAESFETLHADRYANAKLISKLKIKWYPTTVLVSPNNKVLDVIEGYAEVSPFKNRLQTGLASLQKRTELAQLAENQPQ